MGGILIKTLRGWADMTGHTGDLNAGVSAVWSLALTGAAIALALYAIVRLVKWAWSHPA